LFNFRKCPNCGSIWVCWNWVYVTKERHNELNPGNIVDHDIWDHECWDCEWCVGHLINDEKVNNGIPYWMLKWFYFLSPKWKYGIIAWIKNRIFWIRKFRKDKRERKRESRLLKNEG
jgi:hypothetical protein